MRKIKTAAILSILFVASIPAPAAGAPNTSGGNKIENAQLSIEITSGSGNYTVRDHQGDSFTARIAAKVNGNWIFSTDYPQHHVTTSTFNDELGAGDQLIVIHGGRPGSPDLSVSFRLYSNPADARVTAEVRNTQSEPIRVQAIRLVDGVGSSFVNLNGPDAADRVLSDSFSEDRPAIAIQDLFAIEGGQHRAVGSQLIYNRQSKHSLFVGALASEKWLTIARLSIDRANKKITAYEVESTGTTELAKENSLRESGAEDRIELSLALGAGESLASEPLVIQLGSDYHRQLETYGDLIRTLHHARVNAPTPIGWWSWTAFYFGLTEGTAETNAAFLAQRLKPLGYTFFHIDEGYQYARGEYTTANADKFPHGLEKFEKGVAAKGLIPGIWTAPFEISERSWVYQNHPDWVVHNAQGKPINAGFVIDNPEANKRLDRLYILDCTQPEAQEYLRQTYSTLAKVWGIRYIKLDFMDDSAIEGMYHRPNTTALEAQRIGLRTIREAVGENVLLDKDGSPMLNPVGLVDAGRISQDTGHTFEASRDAATGVAARYYMNRNYFIGDPDAFSVSKQTIDEQKWHGGKRSLTLDEAEVSIALSAVSGGMFEIGDDLPTLFLDEERLALLENHDLINMARFAHASTPVDLMDYSDEDQIPSVFLLRETPRTAILTVFNWTDKDHSRRFSWSQLGLGSHNRVTDVLRRSQPVTANLDAVALQLPPRSVRMLKIEDTTIQSQAPVIMVNVPAEGKDGRPLKFEANATAQGSPAVSYEWDFGDGTTAGGASVSHSYTHSGQYNGKLSIEDVEGTRSEKQFTVSVQGKLDTRFDPNQIRRLEVPK